MFSSCGAETAKKFSYSEIESILNSFVDNDAYGNVLRAKGFVASTDGRWIHFDYVPGEPDIRYGSASVIGRICVIGAGIDENKIRALFGV